MSNMGTGPRSGRSRDELDDNLTVYVEIIGEDLDTGHTVIHDPEYLEPPGDHVEMALSEAEEIDAEFCCDCFETAWIESLTADE